MIIIEQVRPEHTWKLRHEVLYPNQKPNEMGMEEDNNGYHFAAFKDKWIVAVVSLFKHESDWQFRKFAVAEEVQGQGLGAQLLQYITEFVEREQGELLWCNARLSAIGFYNKFGFSAVGEVFHKNGFDYIIMQKHLPAQ
ncbi:GNAT family N-acetyltransferase [Mucilaginibacter pedocola]|uniref:GCN5 family acetyltransferase n=1 Tax=Mucilaginibacter pedocola TaxID=1792845 RepID=A0A1S9PGV1_9SPHI|nr:GNAT family N-acetyltransferase [Mucilaginibacter pedocola]OOQ60137.1 GCN5 family acetyltransferase [Mucilaginibacter pedocola]